MPRGIDKKTRSADEREFTEEVEQRVKGCIWDRLVQVLAWPPVEISKVCNKMCADMHTAMCVDMCAGMCIYLRVDMCIDKCVDMCIDMCVDMCIDMYVDMCIDVCTDM